VWWERERRREEEEGGRGCDCSAFEKSGSNYFLGSVGL
jgi:hypothetical protein